MVELTSDGENLLKAVKGCKISEERLDDMVKRCVR